MESFKILFFLFFSCCLQNFCQNAKINTRPIIGILDQPASDDLKPYGSRVLVASYVKWLESSGARVVPVRYDASKVELKSIFNSINGLLLPGGGIEKFDNTTFYENVQYLYSLVIQSNAQGKYFPLWGTCQGFQILAMLTSDNDSIVNRYAFDSENLPLNLDFTPSAPKSRLFSSLSPEIYQAFATKNITMNLHHDGVYPDAFKTNFKLASFYNLLATNVDRKGLPFASAFEGINVPVYGVQFHPERNGFEWDIPELLDHSQLAVRAMQELSQFFVNEARKSFSHFPSLADETRALIYNFTPRFTGTGSDSFPEQQTYIFK